MATVENNFRNRFLVKPLIFTIFHSEWFCFIVYIVGEKDKAADLSGSDEEFYLESNSDEEEESASSGYIVHTIDKLPCCHLHVHVCTESGAYLKAN